MSPSTPSILLIFLGSLISFLYIIRATVFPRKPGNDDRRLPPGPPALPVIGNLHMLGNLPHRSLHRLAQKYGPIMYLRLGSVPTVVVSSPEAAEQFLKTHDLVFASRPLIQAFHYLSYGNKSMALSPYGSYWRNMRKLCTTHLLSSSKIESFAASRMEEMRSFVAALKEAEGAREVVDLSERVAGVVEDMMHRMILGCSKSDGSNLKGWTHEAATLAGAFNLSDYVPVLAPLDLQGLTRSFKRVSKEIDKIFEKIIQQHENDHHQKQQNQRRDFVDILLSMLNKPLNHGDEEVYIVDRPSIKAIILDMIVASFDTSATAVEWAMSELIRHPNVTRKLQEELNTTIGMSNMVEESDLNKLSYLDMVIKETLRLHAVAPFLMPRESMEDAIISSYCIQKKSRVLVNFWSIGRNTNIWSDNSEEFMPERFDASYSNMDVWGYQDFRLIPFGSGRRGCPGLQLGLITTKLVLAQLVHCFDWDLPDGMKPEELDMSEKFGLSLPRANHLLATPTYRLLK